MLIERLSNELTKIYGKLPSTIQAFAGTMARKKLYDMEREAYGKGASKEDCIAFRPAKNEDPVLRLGTLMTVVAKEALKDVEIEVSLIRNDNAEISDISVKYQDKSQTGG